MTGAHRGHTTSPIDSGRLIARLQLERLDARRASIGLPAHRPLALRHPTTAPRLSYRPGAYRHLVAIAVVLAFALAFVGTWAVLDERRPSGYARYVEPSPASSSGGRATQTPS